MVSDIFGTGVLWRSVCTAGSRAGTPENFSKIQVSAIKHKCIFLQKHFSIWVPQFVREANFF